MCLCICSVFVLLCHHKQYYMEFTECKMRGVLSPLCKCPSRELWRREASIDQTIQSARDEMTKCERNLRATVGKVGCFCNL